MMIRTAYLATLATLQLALTIDIAPRIAEIIRVQSAVLQAEDLSAAVLRLGVAGIAAASAAIVLSAPVLALLRHHQRGALRFLGLPAWWVRCSQAGAVLFALSLLAPQAFTVLAIPGSELWDALDEPLRQAAITLMAGGAIAAELLRRSIAPPLVLRECMPIRHIHVEAAPFADTQKRAA
jgi:hypothetical protein